MTVSILRGENGDEGGEIFIIAVNVIIIIVTMIIVKWQTSSATNLKE